MKANAVAETPPVISSITPRSQVMRETKSFVSNQQVLNIGSYALNIEANKIEVVKRT